MIVEKPLFLILKNVGVLVRVRGRSRNKVRVRSSWIEMRFFRVKRKENLCWSLCCSRVVLRLVYVKT